MTDGLAEARVLLRRATEVLDGDVHVPAGQRTRAAGHLGRQALEGLVAQACVAVNATLNGASMRTRLIALAALGPRDVSTAARAAWDGLSRSCHRHPYELAPSHSEVRTLLVSVATVDRWLTATAAQPAAGREPVNGE